ncbi:MAG: hypothetical protein ABI267_01450 [Ginsengibacter sp.]
MDKNLTESILNVCKILNKHSVQYLISGGTAVALHGYVRISLNSSGLPATKYDLDFWYNPAYGNYFKLLNALEDLGQDISEFKEEISPDPKASFFRLEFEKFTLDFLPELNGLGRFSASFKEREIIRLNEIEISFISFDDLIKNKQENARPKDIADIEQLKIIRNKKR